MERNWLIRTSTNQILGPISKAKVLELLQKGSLSLNDELCTGNGYWFYIKERDLVDKYVHGDIPQGYNPISESKSILSKRENPEKTTSINTAPANFGGIANQVTNQETAIAPSSEDLEYPDVTLVAKTLPAGFASSASTSKENIILPSNEDLEFPDVTLVATNLKSQLKGSQNLSSQVDDTLQVPKPSVANSKAPSVQVEGVDEKIIYPDDDNLEYPDFEAIKPVKPDSTKESFSTSDLGLETLEVSNRAPTVEEKKEAKVEKTVRKEKVHSEEKKLLHERKVKASSAPAVNPTPRTMPDDLKKRNDSYLWYILVIIVLVIVGLFFYYYKAILNKPLPV